MKTLEGARSGLANAAISRPMRLSAEKVIVAIIFDGPQQRLLLGLSRSDFISA
jgi:hypothetical protein